jgi:hypothetical protein
MREARAYLFLILAGVLFILVGAGLFAAWDSFKSVANETVGFLGGLIRIAGVIGLIGLAAVIGIQVFKLWERRHIQVVRPGRHGDVQAVLDRGTGMMYLLPDRASTSRRRQAALEAQVVQGSLYYQEEDEQPRQIVAPAQRQIAPPRQQEPEPPVQRRLIETVPAPFDLVALEDWRPRPDRILLAAVEGSLLTVPLSLAWHVILAGPTGGGKTNILRLLLMQLCLFHDVYLINPHYAPTKATSPDQPPEDWRPIQQRLAAYPDKGGVDIENRLKWAVKEIDNRAEREEHGDHEWQENYIFIAIDEYPEVKKRCPLAPDLIATIVRRGRHYKVILINTSQDMLIKTIGGSSGDRNQYNTVFNVGCDDSSARALKVKIEEVPENVLGIRGLSIIRAKLEDHAVTTLGRVPFVSNESLYRHLGQPKATRSSSSQTREEVFPQNGRKTREDRLEENGEAAGRDIDVSQLSNPLMLKRFLNEAGKMQAKGMSIDAILKEFGLPPGGRNNQNLSKLLASLNEQDAAADTTTTEETLAE